MGPSARRAVAPSEPQPQGDGSPEPLYTVDLPERGVQVRVTVRPVPEPPPADDSDAVGESGYGHGV